MMPLILTSFREVVLEIGGDGATYGATSHFWDIAFSPRFFKHGK
jgi:hypothetical protein